MERHNIIDLVLSSIKYMKYKKTGIVFSVMENEPLFMAIRHLVFFLFSV